MLLQWKVLRRIHDTLVFHIFFKNSWTVSHFPVLHIWSFNLDMIGPAFSGPALSGPTFSALPSSCQRNALSANWFVSETSVRHECTVFTILVWLPSLSWPFVFPLKYQRRTRTTHRILFVCSHLTIALGLHVQQLRLITTKQFSRHLL